MLYNLHTHTSFSDGSDIPEKYVLEAIRQGVRILGFSDHSPVPFKNSFAIKNSDEGVQAYCNEINRLKSLYSGNSVEILLGLEVDCIPGITRLVSDYRDQYSFDYFIGSVHLVKNVDTGRLWFIDGPSVSIYDEGLEKIFGNDIRKGVTFYYRQIREMVSEDKPDIVGHLDKIRMHNHNRFFTGSEPWYENEINETLIAIRESGSVVEVNNRGIYKKRSDSLFPGTGILEKINRLKIPVTISADAHRPEELTNYYRETVKILQETGFRSQWVLSKDGWKEVSFSS